MLDKEKREWLGKLVSGSSREELQWVHGYIAGVLQEGPEAPPPAGGNTANRITLVYGTETGNSKKLATELAGRARRQKLAVKLASLDQYRFTDLSKEENLFVVISTQGDGEPPVAAQKFYDHIHRNGFRMDSVKFGVLALGDTSYPMFCKTGEDVDAQLEKLGAKRIVPLCKCDVEYESDAEAWFGEVLKTISAGAPTQKPAATTKATQVDEIKPSRKIYTAEVLHSIDLHDRNPDKQTWHLELATGPVDYLPGDSIGIVPVNRAELVHHILSIAHIDPQHIIEYRGETGSVTELLSRKINIMRLHERTVKKYASITGYDIPEQKADLDKLMQIFPLRDQAQFTELLQALPAQAPRIYTIASSPSAHPDEIHLTVEKEFFETDGATGEGLCSGYLAGLRQGDSFPFFVQKNKRFRLPEPSKDAIMIGPGTGIAAFRSFLFERDATAAGGRNWLFFAEDHFVSDFLYQSELQDLHQAGVLQKISLAFAKDRGGVTLAQRIQSEGKEIFEWLQAGAHLYLCGQKHPMSVDVEEALLSVFSVQGRMQKEEAKQFFDTLRSEGRYSKDVY